MRYFRGLNTQQFALCHEQSCQILFFLQLYCQKDLSILQSLQRQVQSSSFFPFLFAGGLSSPWGSCCIQAFGSWFSTSFRCWFLLHWATPAWQWIFSKDATGDYWSCRLLLWCFSTTEQLDLAKEFCSGSSDTGITFLPLSAAWIDHILVWGKTQLFSY